MEDVGRYRVHRRIAHGGMAEVFEATAEGARGFSRRVAIKRMLAAHDDDPSFARMFLDEARIASQLHHASIVSVLDYGVVDGRPFQALELVDGRDAHAMTKKAAEAGERMPVELALHVCAEIAHALGYAHEAHDANGRPMKIVHRDVSPGNILLSWNGDVKLTDFGIAKAVEREERTQAGMTKGKLVYMSPEQATAGSVDARADVFALGCVLHALLRGKSPLSGTDAMQQLFGDGEIQITEDLPEDVRAIITKATRRDASARYQTAEEMASALGEAAAPRFKTAPRTALRTWLDKLRPPATSTAKQAGKLDDLLDVEIVLGATDDDGLRQFESTEMETSAPTIGLTPPAAEATSIPEIPTRSMRGVVLGALAVLGVGVAALSFILPSSSTDPNASSATTAEPEPSALEPTEPEPTEPVIVEEADAGPAAAPAADVAPPDREPSMRRRQLPRPTAAAMMSANVGSEAEPNGRGVVLIGGAGAHRMEIFVDGRSHGFAPKRLELTHGGHAVELRGADGTPVATRRIELTARHTRTSPERWIVD